MNEKNAPEILTVCVVHFTIHRNSLKFTEMRQKI